MLQRLAIPRQLWAQLTGGLSEGGGHQLFAFNHFRSDKPTRGSKFHRDSGWVTVLRSIEPGLLAHIDGELHAVNPEPGYFIVNFGSSLEVLSEDMVQPVRANVHGVARTVRQAGQADRYSYVVFLDSDLSGDIYRWAADGMQKVQSVAEFAVQEVARTYDAHDQQL